MVQASVFALIQWLSRLNIFVLISWISLIGVLFEFLRKEYVGSFFYRIKHS